MHDTPPAAPAGRAVESRNPASGEVWRTFPAASAEDVAAAVAAARVAQPAWATTPLTARIEVLRRFHESLFRRRWEVADVISRENGKPAAEAVAAEVAVVLDQAEFYRRRARAFFRSPWFGPAALSMLRKRVRVFREPYGVVGVISPWNYPLMLGASTVLPAIVSGNAVLLKPSELTPSTGALLGELFAEAGLPEGILRILQGDGATGAALCRAGVDKIFFTGSVASGTKAAVACAERLIPCALELGGSDPAIVLADADIAHAASGIAWGRFGNAGQTCVAPKRVYVESVACDLFVVELSRVVAGLRLGAGTDKDTDVGPLIRPQFHATLAAQRDDAIARGAKVAAVSPVSGPQSPDMFPPTVLVDVAPGSRVLNEETFGPLLPVIRVKDADEAVALANASEFGLSASVWTRDAARGAALARRIEAGTVSINDCAVGAGIAEVPHGGVKRSGIGRTHGDAGFDECVRTRTIVADQFARWRQAWWFGYSPEHAENIDAFVRFAHARGVIARLGALPNLLRLLFRPRRPL